MSLLSRLSMLLVLALLAAWPATATADDDDDNPPAATTTSASQVTATSARLNAVVDPQGTPTGYRFELGTTTGYGQTTALAWAGSGSSPVTVSADVTGLAPATTYHFRVVAYNWDGARTNGADRTFTTSAGLAPPAPGAGGGTATTSAPPADGGPAQPEQASTPGAVPPPVLGSTVVVSEVSGTILVRVPGAKSAAPLDAAAGVPVGSVVDAREGVVELSSAVGSRTQAGRFWGAVFQVRQSRAGKGMTDLVLRGGRPDGCGRRAGAARVAAVSAKRRPRTGLWGNDKGGRFRTHGRNSVATVRGTTWLVEERCEGTLTRVTEGAVVVRDLRRERSVTVAAGGRYLARDGGARRG